MLDRQESDVSTSTASEQMDRAVVQQQFVSVTSFGEGTCLSDGVHAWRRPVEEFDVAECSDRVEVSRGTHSYVDHGIGIECVGSADREHSSKLFWLMKLT